MTNLIKILVAMMLVLIQGVSAWAEEAAPPKGYRSSPDALVWLSGSVGPEIGLGWGLTGGGGLGFHGGASLRIQPGRCGGIVDYHNDSSMYFFDPAGVHTFVVGAGVACNVLTIEKGPRGFRGSYVSARALVDYGEMDYDITGANTLSGKAYGMGGTLGADFYFPLWVGFWVHAGPSLDVIDYKYKLPLGSRVHFNSNQSESLLVRIGVDYAF